MLYRVQIGEEFEVFDATVTAEEIEIQVELNKARQQIADAYNRTIVAMAVLCLVTVFLIGAAVLGIVDGNFGRLQAVYNVAAVPMSAILAYYFGRNHGGQSPSG